MIRLKKRENEIWTMTIDQAKALAKELNYLVEEVIDHKSTQISQMITQENLEGKRSRIHVVPNDKETE